MADFHSATNNIPPSSIASPNVPSTIQEEQNSDSRNGYRFTINIYPANDGVPSRRMSESRPPFAFVEESGYNESTSRLATFEHAIRESLRRSKRMFMRQLTREALPRVDNYRNIMNLQTHSRPTLEELHESNIESKTIEEIKGPAESNINKLGWIEGVLIRNMLNIWGVMLFLRISWVVAQSGIWQTLIIIALSTFITLVTALSLSAITTNGEIGGGGTYYVMSRSLGPEFGASIGIIFAVANAINASLNVVGFCEAMQDLLAFYAPGSKIVDAGDNDIRIIGTITMIAVIALCGLGTKYESKTQVIMLVILAVALLNFFIGSFIGPKSDLETAKGYLGYRLDLITENWSPAYIKVDGIMQDFFSVFSVFFPAAIGILAGANISGDLRDPNFSIPRGTILAIILTSLSYAAVAIVCAATMTRQATGDLADFANKTWLNCTGRNCTAGMYYDYQAMTLISGFGPLNYAGCFAATLSTALASYVSCPALLVVIAEDQLFPYLGACAKRKFNEPIFAHIFTIILSLVFIWIAQLDQIALLISNFFLITFALMNFCTFHVSLVRPIGWRPTFKFYNMWLSLLCAILCVACMFLISWPTALITFAFVLALYLIVLYRKPEVNWGSSAQAQSYKTALVTMQQLSNTEDHVKNYRPQILVLTGLPSSRPSLVDFAYTICKKQSLMICGHINKSQQTSRGRAIILQKSTAWLRRHKIKAFYTLIDNMTLTAGAAALMQATGVGKMKPNLLLMGYKSDWRSCDKDQLEQYFNVIHTAFDMYLAVVILRMPGGLDYTGVIGEFQEALQNSVENSLRRNGSSLSTASSNSITGGDMTTLGKRKKKADINLKDPAGNDLPKEVVNNITVFQRKQEKGTIDVWWLADDGGLTLLLPHILTTRSNWNSCKLRVFCLANSQDELSQEQQNMAALLAKFRIDFSDVVAISDVEIPPRQATQDWFNSQVTAFTNTNGETMTPVISTAEVLSQKMKSQRHMRLRELLIQHSKSSNIIFMTLPMPRKGTVSAPMYMAWLETLTNDLPPFVLIRGNQTSVLTFYS